jgi:iron(III) transport system substrate-binding protein
MMKHQSSDRTQKGPGLTCPGLSYVCLAPLVAGLLAVSCNDSPETAARVVTIYCSADEAFARPVLAEFSRRSGVEVRPLFDTEAGKTTGLVQRLLSERSRPRADVWWSSEIFGTIQLAEAGVLSAYDSPAAGDIPPRYRDAARQWTGMATRGRVLVYDPKQISADDLPRAWADLARPEYRGRFAMANPLFGTTRGHIAAMAALWGEETLRDYLTALRENGVRITDGNAQSVLLVARGVVALAATDTDDVIVAQARGDAMEMIFPDLDAPDGRRFPGTLWIPNTVALVSGGPNPEAGKRLIDYLLSTEVEWMLARSESANLPVRPALWEQLNDAPRPQSILPGAYQRSTTLDYAAAAALLPRTDALVKEILLR